MTNWEKVSHTRKELSNSAIRNRGVHVLMLVQCRATISTTSTFSYAVILADMIFEGLDVMERAGVS